MFIEDVRDSYSCVGCGNCKNACPTGAIVMQSDDEGFLSPTVDHSKCVNCNKCEKVCPTSGLKYKPQSVFPDAFVVNLKDSEKAKKASSGGLCSELCEQFLKKRSGLICGSVYMDNFRVHHILTDNESDIERMRGSKYVQSDLEDCFVHIKDVLNRNTNVLFIGTGCQVYALKKYLGREYPNLFTIDLICHGVPSPKVQDEYIKWIKQKYGELQTINNRDKKFYPGSYVPLYSFTLKTGKTIKKRYSDDPMADAFFQHLSIRKNCSNCKFKTIHRISDITIGDFWFAEQEGFGQDLYGVNLCLVQSEKGHELLKMLGNSIEEHSIDPKEAILLNGGMLYSSIKANDNRSKFFSELGYDDFDKLVFKYDGIRRNRKIKNDLREVIAPLLRKTKYYSKQHTKSFISRKKRKIPEDRLGLTYYWD